MLGYEYDVYRKRNVSRYVAYDLEVLDEDKYFHFQGWSGVIHALLNFALIMWLIFNKSQSHSIFYKPIYLYIIMMQIGTNIRRRYVTYKGYAIYHSHFWINQNDQLLKM